MNNYSAFQKKKKYHTELTAEEAERAMGLLYSLHSYLLAKEKKKTLLRLSRRKKNIS